MIRWTTLAEFETWIFHPRRSEVCKINVRRLLPPAQITNIQTCALTNPSGMRKSLPQSKVIQKPFTLSLTFISDQQPSKQTLFTFPRRPKPWFYFIKKALPTASISSDSRSLKTERWGCFHLPWLHSYPLWAIRNTIKAHNFSFFFF